MSSRLTRKEKKEQTRTCLLHSAAKVFARSGMHGASVDDVAEEAGFTKGAVYANFASKEELFLAMVDEKFAGRVADIEKVTADGAPVLHQAQEAGGDFARYLDEDPEWQRLFVELCAYAGRNPEFRARLAERYRGVRGMIAGAYARRIEELENPSPVPVEEIATMTFAMANGFALEKLIEPDAVDDELYGRMLSIFFLGIEAMASLEESGASVSAVAGG